MNYYLYGYMCGYLQKTATLAGPQPFDAGGAGDVQSTADTNPDRSGSPAGRNTPPPPEKALKPPVSVESAHKAQDMRGMQ